MSRIIYIGLGSKARVGKDVLAQCLKRFFKRDGIACQNYALANRLKTDVADFLKDKCGYDVWTNDTEVKKEFREFLVWYGKIKRMRSKGKYWLELLNEQVKMDSYSKTIGDQPYIAIVTDIRYAEYEGTDELYWIRNNSGLIINVDRSLPEGGLVEPANEDERRNSEKISKLADINFVWPTMGELSDLISFFDSSLAKAVEPLYLEIIEKLRIHDQP